MHVSVNHRHPLSNDDNTSFSVCKVNRNKFRFHRRRERLKLNLKCRYLPMTVLPPRRIAALTEFRFSLAFIAAPKASEEKKRTRFFVELEPFLRPAKDNSACYANPIAFLLPFRICYVYMCSTYTYTTTQKLHIILRSANDCCILILYTANTFVVHFNSETFMSLRFWFEKVKLRVHMDSRIFVSFLKLLYSSREEKKNFTIFELII